MPYPVVRIHAEWRPETEPMGSKTKFWFRRQDDPAGGDWLFKYPRPGTGEHWAEKIAAEVASLLDIGHANVELARFGDDRGSMSKSFARDGWELHHGNQMLEISVDGYDAAGSFRQTSHTLENIWKAVEHAFGHEAAQRAKCAIAEHLVLDAVIGNTDRHHENWGVLRRRTGDDWAQVVAPSFDHASSLGRELRDDRREQLRLEDRVGFYAEKARGAVYWSENDRRAPSPVELVRQATLRDPGIFGPALTRLDNLDDGSVEDVVGRVPDGWMSPAARAFAIALMRHNLERLRDASPR